MAVGGSFENLSFYPQSKIGRVQLQKVGVLLGKDARRGHKKKQATREPLILAPRLGDACLAPVVFVVSKRLAAVAAAARADTRVRWPD